MDDDELFPPATDVQVVLNYLPLGLVQAHPRSISADGLLVDTGPVLLTENAEVEVTLSYRKGQRTRVRRVCARVAVSEPGATRLAFDAATCEAFGTSLTDGV